MSTQKTFGEASFVTRELQQSSLLLTHAFACDVATVNVLDDVWLKDDASFVVIIIIYQPSFPGKKVQLSVYVLCNFAYMQPDRE